MHLAIPDVDVAVACEFVSMGSHNTMQLRCTLVVFVSAGYTWVRWKEEDMEIEMRPRFVALLAQAARSATAGKLIKSMKSQAC